MEKIKGFNPVRIDKEILSWLTTVPASDINFKSRLKDANIETIKKALKHKGLSKSAVKMMQSRIKKIEKDLNKEK